MSERRLQIFLAEDNGADVFLVREALREYEVEHDLTVVTDGSAAKHEIESMGEVKGSLCPDIFLLDLNMPKADGHELLHSVRVNPHCCEAPVIIVTSSDAPKDRELAAGAAVYFRKPSDLVDFLQLGQIVKEIARKLGFFAPEGKAMGATAKRSSGAG